MKKMALCFSLLSLPYLSANQNALSVSQREKELYLTPAGKYTEADIAANGGKTRSEKFQNFIPVHDRNPQAGDPICPITGVKANAECSWVIAGESTSFAAPFASTN